MSRQVQKAQAALLDGQHANNKLGFQGAWNRSLLLTPSGGRREWLSARCTAGRLMCLGSQKLTWKTALALMHCVATCDVVIDRGIET